MKIFNRREKKEESAYDKKVFDTYIMNRFSWVHFKLREYYKIFLNCNDTKFDDYSIPDEYYQLSNKNNWSNTLKLTKIADNLMSNNDIYINNNELLYDKIESIPNRALYDVSLETKLVDLQMETEEEYNTYKEILWDELETFRHFLPTGLTYDTVPTPSFIMERYKIDLKVLDQDLDESSNNIKNKNKYISNSILDNILFNRIKNYKIQESDEYLNLYYNENLINTNLELFFLDYIKKKRKLLLWF